MADYSLGIAELGTQVDLTGLQSGLSQAEGQARSGMQNAGEGALSVFKQVFVVGLGTLIGNAMTDLVGKISGIGSAISSFLSSNQAFESYNNQFTVLLGSAGAAQQRMQELAQFSATTPFDLPGVVEADRIIQGFGLHTQDSAQQFGFSGTQIRTIAGDVAAGTGTSFADMARYIGQFSAGATGEAMARFAELGIVTRKQLADMGLEFSKSGELLSPLPEAMNVLLTAMQQKYGGLMAVQSSSFEGMASNLSDFVGNAQRTFAAPIFDVFKDGLERLLQVVGAHAGDINAALTSIGTAIANALQPAIMMLANTAIPAALSAFQAFESGVASGGIIGGIGSLIGSLESVSPAFGYIGEGVQLAGDALNEAASIFDEYASAAASWGRNIVEQFANGISSAIGAVYDAVGAVGDAVADLMMPGSPPKFLPNIDVWGQQTMEVWGVGLGQGGGVVQDQIQAIGATASTAFSGVMAQGLTHIAAIPETILPVLTSVSDAVSTTVQQSLDTVAAASTTAARLRQDVVDHTLAVLHQTTATTRAAVHDASTTAEDAAHAAAAAYETRIANIRERIVVLTAQLADATEGSTAYLRIQAQLDAQERALTDTIQAQSDAVAAAKAKAADATQKAADADEAARIRYLISQGQYTDAIAALQQQLATTTAGSADYYKILQQIDQLQQKQADTAAKSAADAAKDAQARLDAQIAYLIRTGDVAQALDLVKGKLTGVETGSVEYYKILSQVNDLEQKIAAEKEKALADQAKAYATARQAQEKYYDQVGRDQDLLAMLNEDLKNTTQGTKAYWDLQTDISKVTERIANAQITYAERTGDVTGAMAKLKDMLASVKDGSDEYFIIQAKIAALEGKKPEDLDKSAKAARDYAYHIADDATRLKMLQEDLAKTKEGSVEWYQLQTKIYDLKKQMDSGGGGGGGGSAMSQAEQEAKKAAAAQWQYNYATADTATKLQMLNEKLAQTKPNSEEYWKLKQQISGVEKTHQGELEKVADAQWQASFRTADQATKIQMLRDKLNGLSPDSEEYYKVLQQLNAEEERAEKANEKHAKAAGGAGAAVKAKKQNVQESIPVVEEANKAIDRASTQFDKLEAAVTSSSGAWAKATPQVQSAINSLAGIVSGTLTAIATAIALNSGLIRQTLVTAWQSAVMAVRSVVGGLVAVVAAVLGMVNAGIRTHGTMVLSTLIQAWMAAISVVSVIVRGLGTAIGVALQVVATFLRNHGSLIMSTLAGAWENAMRAVRTVLTAFGGLLSSIFSFAISLIRTHGQTILVSLMGAWIQATTAVNGVIRSLSMLIATVFNGIAAFLTTHRAAIQNVLVSVWTTIWAAIGAIVVGIGNVIRTALDTVRIFLASHGPQISSLVMNAWAVIGSFVTTAVNSVRLVVTTVLAFVQSFIQAHGQNVLSVLLGAWTAIQGVITMVIGIVQTIIQTVFGAVAGFISANQTSIGNTINTVWTTIGGIIQTITSIIQAVVGAWGSKMSTDTSTNMTTLQNILSTIWTAISALITGALQLIQGILTVVLGAIQGNWSTVWTGVLQLLQGIWTAISGVVMAALNLIANFFGTSLAGIQQTWTHNFQMIGTFITTWVAGIAQQWHAFWTTIITAVQTAVTGVRNAVTTVITTVKNLFAGLVGAGPGIGSDLLAGIARGIMGAVSSIANAAASAVRRAIDAAKRAAGIGSPSRVMHEEVGVELPAGAAGGIEEGTPLLIEKSAVMTNKTIGASIGVLHTRAQEVKEAGAIIGSTMTTGIVGAIQVGTTSVLQATGTVMTQMGEVAKTGAAEPIRAGVGQTMETTKAVVQQGAASMVATSNEARATIGPKVTEIGEIVGKTADQVQVAWKNGLGGMHSVTETAITGLYDQVRAGLVRIRTLAEQAQQVGAALGEGLKRGFSANAAAIEQGMQAVGAPMMRGMATGITGNSKLVADATGAAASQAFNVASSTINDNLHFTANYRVFQSETSVRDDLRFAQMTRARR